MIIYFFQKIIWLPLLITFKLFLHLKVKDRKNFKLIKKNQYFIIANHRSIIDGFLILTATPFSHFLKTNFRFMIAPEWIKKYAFMKHIGGYPIFRKRGNIKKILFQTEKFIKNGKNLLIFPEGKRSKNNKPIPAKQGIGYLAKKYNLPILPIALFGSDEINKNKGLNLKKTFSKKCHIKIKIGKPFYFNDVANYNDNNLISAQKIMNKVNEML